ncbi:MAG: adenosine kinase [SAR202 cluster bacterium]|nr:adenosine kinase [SAR202 cluster bacterium]
MQARYDVYGVGNALVDTEMQVGDGVLSTHGLRKGFMTLVTHDHQDGLLRGLGEFQASRAAGGSAANTMVGVAQFGGRAFYTGKVGADMTGALYRESMAEACVEFDVEASDGAATGTCLILVTPDGERTMQTSLGASAGLTARDVQPDKIAASKVVYVEGYLWGSPGTRAAAEHAMELAKRNGVTVALSLSDPGMVEAFGDEFRRVAKSLVDIVFCNEQEARFYTGGGGSREHVLRRIGGEAKQVFMTCGGDGSLVYDGGRIERVAPYKVRVVDTTGAGDVYAAGVLYGLTHGMSVAQAGKLGSFASALIITTMGPRLRHPLAAHVRDILDGADPANYRK